MKKVILGLIAVMGLVACGPSETPSSEVPSSTVGESSASETPSESSEPSEASIPSESVSTPSEEVSSSAEPSVSEVVDTTSALDEYYDAYGGFPPINLMLPWYFPGITEDFPVPSFVQASETVYVTLEFAEYGMIDFVVPRENGDDVASFTAQLTALEWAVSEVDSMGMINAVSPLEQIEIRYGFISQGNGYPNHVSLSAFFYEPVPVVAWPGEIIDELFALYPEAEGVVVPAFPEERAFDSALVTHMQDRYGIFAEITAPTEDYADLDTYVDIVKADANWVLVEEEENYVSFIDQNELVLIEIYIADDGFGGYLTVWDVTIVSTLPGPAEPGAFPEASIASFFAANNIVSPVPAITSSLNGVFDAFTGNLTSGEPALVIELTDPAEGDFETAMAEILATPNAVNVTQEGATGYVVARFQLANDAVNLYVQVSVTSTGLLQWLMYLK